MGTWPQLPGLVTPTPKGYIAPETPPSSSAAIDKWTKVGIAVVLVLVLLIGILGFVI